MISYCVEPNTRNFLRSHSVLNLTVFLYSRNNKKNIQILQLQSQVSQSTRPRCNVYVGLKKKKKGCSSTTAPVLHIKERDWEYPRIDPVKTLFSVWLSPFFVCLKRITRIPVALIRISHPEFSSRSINFKHMVGLQCLFYFLTSYRSVQCLPFPPFHTGRSTRTMSLLRSVHRRESFYSAIGHHSKR